MTTTGQRADASTTTSSAPAAAPAAGVGAFSAEQIAQLLKPIAASRVALDGKNKEHVSQQDIVAHLIRVFGFGAFDTEVLDLALVFESPRLNEAGNPVPGRWDVCYKAVVRLTVRDLAGMVVCQFEDASTGDAQNQGRADAHDLAMKSAVSLAKKRCAINLGDQFGLSLYNKGQRTALVKGTLADPTRPRAQDVQVGVEQQTLSADDGATTEPPQSGDRTVTGRGRADDWVGQINACTTLAAANHLFAEIKNAGAVTEEIKQVFTTRSASIRTGG